MSRFKQPISPHLSIYKPQITSILSIIHRFTGIFLSLGSALVSLWVLLIALGPSYYNLFELISSYLVFKIFLFFWTVGVFYHLFNGIRYLFWSFGKGMDLNTVYLSGYLVIILSISSSIVIWFSI